MLDCIDASFVMGAELAKNGSMNCQDRNHNKSLYLILFSYIMILHTCEIAIYLQYSNLYFSRHQAKCHFHRLSRESTFLLFSLAYEKTKIEFRYQSQTICLHRVTHSLHSLLLFPILCESSSLSILNTCSNN